MNRRELLKLITVITGASMVGGDFLLSGCTAGGKAELGFTEKNMALLDEIGETIIPTTHTPGAKAAKVSEYMKVMVSDCYTTAQQESFTKGIGTLEEACKKIYSKNFIDCTPEERHAFLLTLEPEAKEYNQQQYEKDKPEREKFIAEGRPYNFVSSPLHYYTLLKQLTIAGYFSSEIGSKQALRLVAVPGKFDGNYPYKKGDRAFAY